MRKVWNCKGSVRFGNGCMKCDRCIDAVQVALDDAPKPTNEDEGDGFNVYGSGPAPIAVKRGA